MSTVTVPVSLKEHDKNLTEEHKLVSSLGMCQPVSPGAGTNVVDRMVPRPFDWMLHVAYIVATEKFSRPN
jgi:hypothetical protein